MGVTRMIDLISTFAAQCCMSVGMAGHERVKGKLLVVLLDLLGLLYHRTMHRTYIVGGAKVSAAHALT